ncbi:MAG: hypothetical protein Q4B71_00775 [Cardiobacteriaceae bacterium]|nr:hypothetical protein [Cardiobacteriaceae bacterium]
MGRLNPRHLAYREQQSALARELKNPYPPKRFNHEIHQHLPTLKQKLPRPPDGFTRFLDKLWFQTLKLGEWVLKGLMVMGFLAGLGLLLMAMGFNLPIPLR